jgi:hypothetical protein
MAVEITIAHGHQIASREKLAIAVAYPNASHLGVTGRLYGPDRQEGPRSEHVAERANSSAFRGRRTG